MVCGTSVRYLPTLSGTASLLTISYLNWWVRLPKAASPFTAVGQRTLASMPFTSASPAFSVRDSVSDKVRR